MCVDVAAKKGDAIRVCAIKNYNSKPYSVINQAAVEPQLLRELLVHLVFADFLLL